MMAAIKVRGDLAGERGARADWVWEFWDQDWTFRKESEFWGACSRYSIIGRVAYKKTRVLVTAPVYAAGAP
jgi:hypothetical protein